MGKTPAQYRAKFRPKARTQRPRRPRVPAWRTWRTWVAGRTVTARPSRAVARARRHRICPGWVTQAPVDCKLCARQYLIGGEGAGRRGDSEVVFGDRGIGLQHSGSKGRRMAAQNWRTSSCGSAHWVGRRWLRFGKKPARGRRDPALWAAKQRRRVTTGDHRRASEWGKAHRWEGSKRGKTQRQPSAYNASSRWRREEGGGGAATAWQVEEGVGEGPGRWAASGRHDPGAAAMGRRRWHAAMLRGDEARKGKGANMWAWGHSARWQGWLTCGAWLLYCRFKLFKPIQMRFKQIWILFKSIQASTLIKRTFPNSKFLK
jgi:hypothetical protein